MGRREKEEKEEKKEKKTLLLLPVVELLRPCPPPLLGYGGMHSIVCGGGWVGRRSPGDGEREDGRIWWCGVVWWR